MSDIDLTGQPGEVRMTLTIKRAATGETETVELIGHVIPQPEAQPAQETSNEPDPQHGGA